MSEYQMLNSVAYDHLLEMIHRNELEFNRIYSETRVAAELNISRTPVREALVRLSNERYIDILPSRGFMLHKPTPEDIGEAYHVRMAIETYCARLLARARDSECAEKIVADMRAILSEQSAVNAQSYEQHRSDFWQLDVRFHARLIDCVESETFEGLFNTFMHFFISLRIKNFICEGRNHATLREHERIVDALGRGDERAAQEALLIHLDNSLRTTLEGLEEE